ncbi:MAG: 3'-5' exonuclease, partial [Bacillota bacterium]|nr:3'-5' exonuclease [Bacillota bacterium]
LEEEKRVLYVAMTRAKKSLTLLTAVAGSSANEGELFVPKSDMEKKRYIDMIEPYIGDYIESYDTESVVRDLVAWKQSRSAYAHAGSPSLQREREEAPEILLKDEIVSDASPEQD